MNTKREIETLQHEVSKLNILTSHFSTEHFSTEKLYELSRICSAIRNNINTLLINNGKSKFITKESTIDGYEVRGESIINLWGGGQGVMEMINTFIPIDMSITKEKILGCVNDGGFGCESIESAELDIYTCYNDGARLFNRSIFVDGNKQNYQKYFHKGV